MVTENNRLAGYSTLIAQFQLAVLPNWRRSMVIRYCLQNSGELSKRKRADFFESLTDAEIKSMESAVQRVYQLE